MITMNGRNLTAQGAKIVEAIEGGLAAMTRERWSEIRQAEREDAEAGIDDGAHEWFAPEFEAAREATEGIQWDFTGWREALRCITTGEGKLGGVELQKPTARTYYVVLDRDGNIKRRNRQDNGEYDTEREAEAYRESLAFPEDFTVEEWKEEAE